VALLLTFILTFFLFQEDILGGEDERGCIRGYPTFLRATHLAGISQSRGNRKQ